MSNVANNPVIEQAGKLDGIFDVLPPAMPIQTSYDGLLIITVAILLVALSALLMWRYQSARGKASRKLRTLARLLQQQDLDQRQTAYSLATILRNGLKLNRLSFDTRLPPSMLSEHSRWQHYIERMASARYSRNSSDSATLSQLLHETRYWLRRWP